MPGRTEPVASSKLSASGICCLQQPVTLSNLVVWAACRPVRSASSPKLAGRAIWQEGRLGKTGNQAGCQPGKLATWQDGQPVNLTACQYRHLASMLALAKSPPRQHDHLSKQEICRIGEPVGMENLPKWTPCQFWHLVGTATCRNRRFAQLPICRERLNRQRAQIGRVINRRTVEVVRLSLCAPLFTSDAGIQRGFSAQPPLRLRRVVEAVMHWRLRIGHRAIGDHQGSKSSRRAA